MSFVYWLSKFSHEAMLIELFLIACISASYFLYLLVQKRRYGVAKKNIPDNVVRAYLIEMISQAEGFKNQLFGENFQIPAGHAVNFTAQAQPAVAVTGGADAGELAAIKAALADAVGKQDGFQKSIATLTKEKAALEAKLAAAGTPPPASGGGDPKALTDATDKIAKLESKLAEYEVIEDDLANLKKYQQENKTLRAQLDSLQKGGGAPTLSVVPPPPPAQAVAAPTQATPNVAAAPAAPPAPVAAAPSPVAAAEESAAATQAVESFEGLVDKVEESLAPLPPAGASAADPLAAKTPPAAAAAADEPALSEPAGAPPKEKSDADLLNEFERMLSS